MSKVLTYRMTLTSPLILTAPGGDANSADTHLFIPGSAVRGALVSVFMRSNGRQDAVDSPFRRLFLSGDVRYLNAYPEGPNQKRFMPAPVSLKVEKRTQEPVYDLAAPDKEEAIWNEDEDEGRSARPMKDVPGRFVLLSPPTVFHYTPATRIQFHHQRNRKAGRPVEGDIFTYVSMERGEQFIGHILMESDGDAQQIQELLRAPWRLGRSGRTEYGGSAEVEVLSIKESTDWTEMEKPNIEVKEGYLVVTLLSDYLPENETGQATVTSLVEALKEEGVPVDPEDEVECCYVRDGIQGGYLGVWHLPLPQARSLQAGSVVMLKTPSPLCAATLVRLEWSGVGARRAEGFGRLCFNRHGGKLSYSPCSAFEPGPALSASGFSTNTESDALLEQMRKTLLQQTLDRRLLYRADSRIPKKMPPVPRSLLGRLRTCVRNADAPDAIRSWIRDAGPKKAATTLNKVRIEGRPLLQWIESFLSPPPEDVDPRVWRELRARDACRREALLDDADSTLALLNDAGLIWTYQRRFLEALLARVMERTKESEHA